MPKAQAELPGTERAGIKEIEEAAEELRTIRNKRLKLQVDEKAAALALKQVMEENGAKSYTYEADVDGEETVFDVSLESKEKVFVRVHHDDDEDAEGEV